MDYNDFQIDIRNLHVEWLKQPALRAYWGKEQAEAGNERDALKKQLDELKAEKDIYFRRNWQEVFPDIKLTEGSISSVILINTEYQELHDKYLESVKKSNTITNIMKTLDDRKYALENEVKLYIANYFDDHNIPDKVNEFVAEKTKEVSVNDLGKNERLKKIRKKRSVK